MTGPHGSIHSVLFVCVGNICRSPMAAALARSLLGHQTTVESAGTAADDGSAATQDAIEAMRERGLDIASHRSRSIRSVRLTTFDVVVALTPAIAESLRKHGVDPSKLRTLSVPDPIGCGLDAYRDTADAIERDVTRIFGEENHDTR
jgi:protein-tyrosine phosphatase